MSAHDLIEFVQQHYSGLQGASGGRQRNPNVVYAPAPDDLNAIQGERPPVPDWLPEEGDASVVALGADDVLSPEGQLAVPGTDLELPGNPVTIDTLAYYLPYHFYSSRWGIYLKASGILHVASLLKDALFSVGDEDVLQLAQRILFEHEFFHFIAETACARAEVVAKMRLYDVYYPHPFGAPHEEALANAYSFRKALVGQPASVKKIFAAWMEGQGPGYRDYARWLGRKSFDDGCRRSAHYIFQPIGKVALAIATAAGSLSASEGLTARRSAPSKTVLRVDLWDIRRGEEIAAEWREQGIGDIDPLVVADAHTCLFSVDPQLAEYPQDLHRSAWWKLMMETPEYQELHAQTFLKAEKCALAARTICDWWAAYAPKYVRPREGQLVGHRGGAGPLAPSDFLFAIPTRDSVPTRLVLDTRVDILKPFPKYAGMRVVVHTNDHPPPHFHIERPPGRPLTRYLWPELTPYPGDPELASSGARDLRSYVDRFRRAIDEKVQNVYQSASRPNKTLKLTAAAR
jgi:hypothetical protein